ncbi:hypothetical protein [Citrobacter telavivensis]|uniref:hypothetical protein n=1 Tax=Citrobacter telavivensis TaxID=2653932 RepID=UPI00359DA1F5
MPEFCFYQKGQHTRTVKRSDAKTALRLTEQGYEKQFEEINAADEEQALARFADIRKEKQIDQQNFLAGAGVMPLIGIIATAMVALFRKK